MPSLTCLRTFLGAPRNDYSVRRKRSVVKPIMPVILNQLSNLKAPLDGLAGYQGGRGLEQNWRYWRSDTVKLRLAP